jgi:tRNA1Val (adenine37-N6)-methyltransferase
MSIFHFKNFSILQNNSAVKVGTDAMLLGAFCEAENPSKILDVGTGTGVLSLMMAQKNQDSNIDAIEIDKETALEAIYNFTNSKYASRIQLFQLDFFNFSTSNVYDLIVSNPPYFENSIKSNSNKKIIAKHISSSFIDLFFQKSKILLSSKGLIWIIVPFETSENWNQSAMRVGLYLKKRINIKGNSSRFVRSILIFSLVEETSVTEEFCVRNDKGMYTKEYQELTEEFHSKVPLR